MTISSGPYHRDITSRSKCILILSLMYRLKWIRYLLLTMIFLLVIFCVSLSDVKHNAHYIKYIQNSDIIKSDDNNDKINDMDELLLRHEREDVKSDYRVDVRIHNAVVQRRINNDKNSDRRQSNINDSEEDINTVGDKNSASFHMKYNGDNNKEAKNENINDYFIQGQVRINNVRPKQINRLINDNDGAINHQKHRESVTKTNAHHPEENETENKVSDDKKKMSVNEVKISVDEEKVSVNAEKISVNEEKSTFDKEKMSDKEERMSKNVDTNDAVEYVSSKMKQNVDAITTSPPSPHQQVTSETLSRDNTIAQPTTTTNLPTTTEARFEETKPVLRNTKPLKTTQASEKKCKPAKNVIFLKTHKTGSSTIINIMQRHAHTHDLKVALPNITHFLGWPRTFEERFVFEHKRGMKYNILCNHARFHRQRMLNIMADKDTKIVTIIRDPLYQFESTAVYLNFYALFRINRKLNLLDAFFNKSKADIYARTKKRNTHNVFLVKNPIAYDMGFPTWRESSGMIKDIVEKVKNSFNLVMISDYMAESLAMLKEELCWDLKDIVYFTMNKRPDKYRQKMKDREKLRQKVKNWNKIDYAIFEHYNKTFWERVQRGGEAFKKNVEKLKETNEWLKQMCLESGRHYDKSQPWFPILGFKLKPESKDFKFRTLCENMIRSEIDYTNLLKLKQTRLNWTIPTKPPKKKKYKPKFVETRPPNVETTNTDETPK